MGDKWADPQRGGSPSHYITQYRVSPDAPPVILVLTSVVLPDDVLDQSMDVAGYPIRIHPPTASRPYHQIVYRVDGERRVTSGGRTIKTATDKAAAIAARLAADADQARRGAIPADQFSPGSNSVSESLCRRGLGAWSAPATETAC